MEFGQRLKNLRLNKGLTQRDLAELIRVTEVAVRNWERGARKPSLQVITSLCNALEVSADLLLDIPYFYKSRSAMILSPIEKELLDEYQSLDLYGKKSVETICHIESERIKANRHSNISKFTPSNNAGRGNRFIPHYATPSAAGVGIPLDGEDFEMMLVDDNVPPDADYAVNIQGDSMYPYISDGDMVYVKKTEELSIGDVGIFCVDGIMYCKQYYVNSNGDLILVSANPKLKHTNIFISAENDNLVVLCGKVLINQRIKLPDYLFED